jgi:PKD repeat protein
MKTNVLIAISFITVLLTACHDEYYAPPKSCFSTEYTEYEIGEDVYFRNCSTMAQKFVWDFGDGFISEAFEPTYVFTKPGLYNVKLRAIGVHGENVSFITLKIVSSPTILSIRVMFKGTTNPVTDCNVRLYPTQTDFDKETNMVGEGYTNKSGDVEFTNLQSVIYFVDAYKKAANGTGHYSNWNLGIRTKTLEAKKVNYYDIFVEYSANKSKTKRYIVTDIVQGTKR